MTPRGSRDSRPRPPLGRSPCQLATSHHSRLPTCRESLDQLVGVLPVRRLLASIGDPEFDKESLLSQLQAPYYIPAGTAVFSQLAFFQENRQRIGFIVNEYGEILVYSRWKILKSLLATSLPHSPDWIKHSTGRRQVTPLLKAPAPCVTLTACWISTSRLMAPKH